MKNNKGFTLVEILAVVVILGILTGVAVPAVSHFIGKSRQKSYEMMEESLYEAAKNYVMNESIESEIVDAGESGYKLDANMLMESKYLESLTDPANKNKNCQGSVTVRFSEDSSLEDDALLGNYEYWVVLKCSKYINGDGVTGGVTYTDNDRER